MKAKEGVVELLNGLLTHDLTAINQYFVHAEMCRHWGYDRLYHKIRQESISEMKHAEEIIGHILYLEGTPSMKVGTVNVGKAVPDQFKLDLKQEQDGSKLLNEAIAHCVKVGDNHTRHKLDEMLEDSEDQIEWIETQLETIRQTGAENYLSEQIKKEP